MVSNTEEKALKEIVEGYFQGENLIELIQASKDKIIINKLKENLQNLKGV